VLPAKQLTGQRLHHYPLSILNSCVHTLCFEAAAILLYNTPAFYHINSCHPQAAQLSDEADGAASFALLAEQLRESLDRMLRIDSQSKAKVATSSSKTANNNSNSSGDSAIAGSFLRGLQSSPITDTTTNAFGSSNANYSNSSVTTATTAAVTVQVIHVPLHVSVIAGGCFALCGAAAARVFPLQQWQLRQQHTGMHSSGSSSSYSNAVPSLTSGQLLPEVCCYAKYTLLGKVFT
jgi:hypothetical protein